jgi:hypothetical protein
LYDDSRNSKLFGCLLEKDRDSAVNKIVIVTEIAALVYAGSLVLSQEIDD